MRAFKSKSLWPVFIAALLFTLCFLFSSAHAVGGISDVRIVPGFPSIETDIWAGTAGSLTYLTGNYKKTGNTIEIDLYFLNYMDPDRLYACVCGNWESTLNLDFLGQGDYEVVSRLWYTKDPSVLDKPSEQLNFNDFTFWQSYDYTFSLDRDYTSTLEPGLNFEDNIWARVIDLEPSPIPIIDDGPIFHLPTDMKSIFVERFGNGNLTSPVVITPEPTSILLFACGLGLLRRTKR